MDLSTIQTNVKHNLYESLAEFDRDLQKIWKNAMQYNQRVTFCFYIIKRIVKYILWLQIYKSIVKNF